MIESLLIIIVQFIILSLLGVAALSVLSESKRDLLLPAAPIFGAALLAVTMTTTSWFWSAQGGLLATVLVAAGIVALAVYRGRRPWRISLPALGTAALVILVSVPGLAAALLPAWITGDNMAVMPNANHDAYYYAAETAWLEDFPISPGPVIADTPGEGNATPAYGPMRTSLDMFVRMGQPMVHAALDFAMGTDSVQTVTPLAALWVMLFGPAAFVAASLVGLRRWAALAAAALSACCALLVQQAYQQNMDSLLGGSLAMLAIATIVTAMRVAAQRGEPAAASVAERPPRWPNRFMGLMPGADALWPSVLLLAALVAVYVEYALFVGPALVGALLLDRARGFTARLASLACIGLLAIALAPTAWIRGIRTVLVSRPADNFPSPFMNVNFDAAARLLGVTDTSGSAKAGLMVALVAVFGLGLLGGIAMAMFLNRHRGAWIAMVAVGGAYAALLTYQGKGYTQYRTILLFTPLLVLVIVIGWAELLTRLRQQLARAGQRPARAGWGVIVVATALAVIAGVAVNLKAATGTLNREWVLHRHVDSAYTEALDWAKAYGGADGREVSVVGPDIASQMWLAYTLRDLRLVSYPALRPDYLVKYSYWDGAVDPYYIVGPGAFYTGGTEVRDHNSRFTLVHLGERGGAVATPTDLTAWNAHAGTDGSMAGSDPGTVLVAAPKSRAVLVLASRLAVGQQVVLKVRSGAEGASVFASWDGKEVATAKVAGGVAELRLDLGGRQSALLQVGVVRDGAASAAFDLIGVGLSAVTASAG